MPAVLLEAGSIVNRDEELELDKPERRALIADAVADAVESFCDAHGHRIAEAPPHPAHAPTVSGQTATGQTSKNARAADEGQRSGGRSTQTPDPAGRQGG